MNDKKFFDKKTSEEELPVEIDNTVQAKYEKLNQIYEEYFEENSISQAKQSSKEEREMKKLDDSSFVYGEIVTYHLMKTFRSFAYIFEYIKATFGADSILPGTFMDLGSGVGRGIIAASLIHPFEKYTGIEYLERLHLLALTVKDRFSDSIEKIMKEHPDLFSFKSTPVLEVYNGDFLEYSWSDASFIFANSTCFSAELMNKLSKKSSELKKGTFFVTFTKKLPGLGEAWEVKEGFKRIMSWGIATVYVHRKIE